MFGKTRLASRSKLRLAGGNQRMTAAKVVPRLRDRTSKDRHCETANADHKGKYLARWTKDFRDTVDMTFYRWFSGINQSENFKAIFGAESARTPPPDVATKLKCEPLLSAQMYVPAAVRK
jgi:hypothetical protein